MEQPMDYELPQERQRGIPLDLTKEEYTAYYMTIAKMFGSLRMQKPSLVLFGIYAVVTVVFTVTTYLQTGVIDWLMLLILGVTVISSALTYFIMPARTRRKAGTLYDAGNVNGYYGELVINRLEITKLVGEGEDVTVPLTEKSIFIESAQFMALFTVGGQKAIILPARCITKETAAAIREAVFAEGCRVVRRVIARMPAAAAEPIARRELLSPAKTLYTCEITFEPQEIKEQIKDTGTKQFVQSLPMVTVFALLIGSMAAIIQESLVWFFAAGLAVVLGMLLLSVLSSSAKAKQSAALAANARMRAELTDRGVVLTTRGNQHRVFMQWNSMEYITERPECVELSGLDQIVRIPKRHIDDFEEFRAVVDAHFTPKRKTRA